MRQAIVHKLLESCERYPLPEIWRRVGGDADTYCNPACEAATIARLEESFTDQQLITAGVVHPTSNGLSLAPALAEPDGVLIPLRTSSATCPNAVLTASGVLGEDGPDFLGAIDAIKSHELTGAVNCNLFVAFSVSDLVVLRAFGMSCVLAAGLDECLDGHFEALSEQLDWRPFSSGDFSFPEPLAPLHDAATQQADDTPVRPALPAETEEAHQENEALNDQQLELDEDRQVSHSTLQLFFLGWSPATLGLEAPEELPALVKHLINVQNYLDRDLSNVGIWRPTLDSIEKLRILLAIGSREAVRSMLIESLNESTSTLDGFAAQILRTAPPNNYSAALAAVQQTDHTRDTRESRLQRENAQQYLQAAIQRDLVNPLAQSGLASNDPAVRAQTCAAACILDVLMRQIPIVDKHLTQAAESLETDFSYLKSVSQLLATVDRLVKCLDVSQ